MDRALNGVRRLRGQSVAGGRWPTGESRSCADRSVGHADTFPKAPCCLPPPARRPRRADAPPSSAALAAHNVDRGPRSTLLTALRIQRAFRQQRSRHSAMCIPTQWSCSGVDVPPAAESPRSGSFVEPDRPRSGPGRAWESGSSARLRPANTAIRKGCRPAVRRRSTASRSQTLRSASRCDSSPAAQ